MLLQLNLWHRLTFQRYGLTAINKSESTTLKSSKKFKIYLNHPFYWSRLQKISLHATSGKLYTNGSIYGSFNLTFSCASTQTPRLIKSRQNVSAFKLVKASPIAIAGNLRGKALISFVYKWTWLSAKIQTYLNNSGQTLGLSDVFVFPELDQLNYYAFEPLRGFEIHFHHGKTKKPLK